METSPEVKNIASALRKFRTIPVSLTKDGTNPHFKSKFATLNNTIESVEAALETCGLAFSQFPDGDGLTTILMHDASGEWIKATARLALDKQTPQGQGSAITYMRRYALSAALGLVTEDDDDGNEASKSTKPIEASKPVKAAVKHPVKPVDAQKKEIAKHMAALGHPITKETAMDEVKKVTKLELVEELYPEIIRVLADLIEEKNSEQ